MHVERASQRGLWEIVRKPKGAPRRECTPWPAPRPRAWSRPAPRARPSPSDSERRQTHKSHSITQHFAVHPLVSLRQIARKPFKRSTFCSKSRDDALARYVSRESGQPLGGAQGACLARTNPEIAAFGPLPQGFEPCFKDSRGHGGPWNDPLFAFFRPCPRAAYVSRCGIAQGIAQMTGAQRACLAQTNPEIAAFGPLTRGASPCFAVGGVHGGP